MHKLRFQTCLIVWLIYLASKVCPIAAVPNRDYISKSMHQAAFCNRSCRALTRCRNQHSRTRLHHGRCHGTGHGTPFSVHTCSRKGKFQADTKTGTELDSLRANNTSRRCCGQGAGRRQESDHVRRCFVDDSGRGKCLQKGQRRGMFGSGVRLHRSWSDPVLTSPSYHTSNPRRHSLSTVSQQALYASSEPYFSAKFQSNRKRNGPRKCRQEQSRQGNQESDFVPRRVVMDFLFDHADSIVRTKKEIMDPSTGNVVGVQAVTTSKDKEVARAIQTHVQQMKGLMESGVSIRIWDPLFREVAKHHENIAMDVEEIDGGVRVEQKGKTLCATALVQTHSDVVSKFVEKGWSERPKSHQVPKACAEDAENTSA